MLYANFIKVYYYYIYFFIIRVTMIKKLFCITSIDIKKVLNKSFVNKLI